MRNQNSIGVINKVFPNKIVMEISNSNKLIHNYKGDLYTFAGINNFITIYQSNSNKFIYQVIGLYEQENPIVDDEMSKFKEKLYFEAVPLGEIENQTFNFGLSKFPMVGDSVFLTLIEDVNSILRLNDKESYSITLGKMASFDSYYPQLNIDSLFSHHTSVLGNTGSGKSTTARKLIAEVINKLSTNTEVNNANFIIFDVHDEYESIPLDYLNRIDVEKELSIPIESLNKEDWINLVQPSPGVQLPVLMNGLRLGNLMSSSSNFKDWINAYCALFMYENVHTDVVGKRAKIIKLLEAVKDNGINQQLQNYNSQYANFRSGDEESFKRVIKEFIKKLSGYEYEECKSIIEESIGEADCTVTSLSYLETGIDMVLLFEEIRGNDQARSHCSTLMTRIENLISTYKNTLFDNSPHKLKTYSNVMKFEKGFTVFKISSLDDTDLTFFTSYFLRILYSKQKQIRKSDKNINNMYHIVLDEAHKYIHERNFEDSIYSLRMFEQIAKEGRKFGIFMILVSQRPGELSKTVLSQCNNFILHRIRNNIDLDQMRKSIPYLTESQLTRISFLRTGSALLVGEAFSIPMEIIIDGNDQGSSSSTLPPSKAWKMK
ncbi:ATP-binding protein [Alkalicoccus daliensis]|uniref:Helicase HerA central domain-containing protein n=1 Tax=Alkalicoccus daliensis TaxID=745820 RepID=A0A1H0JXT7_9BACI|nr:ATP-binding protein [Alkalicoccus daliensis]SDO48496.1 hypothetical protein SAMN04488053_11531 [Alkalicoccus daliensis]